MKKRILVVLVAAVLASTAFASGHGGGGDGSKKKNQDCMMKDSKGGKNCNKDSKGGHSMHGKMHKGMGSLMMALSTMDLDDKQWVEIKKLKLDMKKTKLDNYKDRSLKNYFSDNGSFNRDSFVKDRLELAKVNSAAQGDFIEKVGSILTKEQKEQMKSKLEAVHSKRGMGPKKGCK